MKKSFMLILLAFPAILFSQPYFDLLNIKYQYFPNQYFKNGTGKRIAAEFDGTLMIPLIQKDSSAFLGGIFYKNIYSNDLIHAYHLYSGGLYFGYDYKWKNKKWSTTAIFIPKINGDKFDFTKRNSQFGGVVLFKFIKSTRVHYNFGLYYNRELFGNYFVPLIGIYWKASEKLNVFGNLPSNFNLEYKINSSLFTGVSYSSFTGTFALHDIDDLYVREGDKHIGYSQLRLFLNWYLMKRFVLFFEPGFTHKRVYALYDSSDDKVSTVVSALQSKIDDGYFIVAGLAYRIRIDK